MNTPQTTTTCSHCGKALTDPESVKLGIGPDCRERQAASLGAIGSSVQEIGALTLLDNPTVTFWVKKAAAALRAGRKRDLEAAERFMKAAREAISVPPIREAEAEADIAA